MRRLIALILAITVLLLPVMGRAEEAGAPPIVPARAYLLMDAANGNVLYAHEGGATLPMASTTKIMTAIVALERGKMTDVVTAGQTPYDTGGSTIYLDLGEEQTLENLMYALLLESANDAAVAIAEHVGGTEERFVDWMNEKAAAIGARRTHFVNSHGLHDPDHYTTAHDLALIARYAMQNPEFRRFVTTEEREIPGFRDNPPRKLLNHNRLLGYYEGNTGVKNGYTEEALLTNVASAKRGDMELIAVVLGAENLLWTSSMALLDYGFSHFLSQRIVGKGEAAGRVTIPGAGEVEARAAADLWVTIPLDGTIPERSLLPTPGIKFPVAAGAPIGTLVVNAGGKELGSVPVVAGQAAEGIHTAGISVRSDSSWMWLLLTVLPLVFLGLLARYRRPL